MLLQGFPNSSKEQGEFKNVAAGEFFTGWWEPKE